MPRRSPGEGQVFFSKAKGVWLFRAPIGFKPDGRVRYVEGRGKTRADAVRKLKTSERIRAGQAHGLTVAVYLARWLADVARPNVRASTWQRYEQIVRIHLIPRLGGQRLDRLTPAHCTAFYAELHRAKVTPGTIRKVSEVLATAMEHAVGEGLIPTAPTRAAVKPRVPDPAIEIFTDDEIRRILTAAQGHRLHGLFALAVGTGMRMGELLALDWSDVAPDCSWLHVRQTVTGTGQGHRTTVGPPKSARGVRMVDLPGFAAATLLARRPPDAIGPVFAAMGTTERILRSNLRHQEWRPLLELAGVPYRKFHTTRHTAASRLLAAGVDVVEVARILGDRPEVVLRVYGRWIPGRGREAAEKLDRIYGEGGGSVANPEGKIKETEKSTRRGG